MSIQYVFKQGRFPVRGLASAISDGDLAPGSGLFRQLQNVRWADTGYIYIRQKTQTLGSLGAGTVRGLRGFTFNGIRTLFGVVKTSGKTSVWKSTDAGINWSEITESTGNYGDTRFSEGSGDYLISMAVVHDKTSGRDHLVVQNGADFPLVYNGTDAAKHEPISLPPNLGGMRTRLSWAMPLGISDPASTTFTNSGGMALADGDTDPDNFLVLSIDNLTAQDDAAEVSFVDSVDWSGARMIFMLLEGTSDSLSNFVDNVKIEVEGTVAATLYDPTALTNPRPVVVPQGQFSYVGYHVPNSWTNEDIDTVRFIWSSASSPLADYEINIMMMCCSNTGQPNWALNGACQHTISYQHSVTRAESPGVVLPVQMQRLENLGTKRNPNVSIPNDPLFCYTATVFYSNTSEQERDKGVNYLNVYRKDFGETTASLVSTVTIANAAWTYANGTEYSIESFTETTQLYDKRFARPAPSAFNLPIPIGRCMVAANGRLCVGAKAENSPSFPRVAISYRGMPFRFSEVADAADAFTAAEDRLPDGESAVAMVAVAGGSGSSVLVLTESGIHTIATHVAGSAQYLTRTLSIGTASPLSVAERQGAVYFLDTDARVRVFAGGSAQVISLPVDDKLQGIPSAKRGFVAGCWHRDRYYLAYNHASASANTRVLVFSERAGAWESDDQLTDGVQFDALCSFSPDSGSQGSLSGASLFFLSGAGSPVSSGRYENALGSETIQMEIRAGDFQIEQDGTYQAVHIKNGAILCDGNTATLTIGVRYKRGTDCEATVSLSDATAYDWAKAHLIQEGASSPAAAPYFTGALPAGTRIYSLACTLEPRNRAPRVE